MSQHIGRLLAALEGIEQCTGLDVDNGKRCLLTQGHEAEMCVWTDGTDTITWKAASR